MASVVAAAEAESRVVGRLGNVRWDTAEATLLTGRPRLAVRAVNMSAESRPRVWLDAKRIASEAASART